MVSLCLDRDYLKLRVVAAGGLQVAVFPGSIGEGVLGLSGGQFDSVVSHVDFHSCILPDGRSSPNLFFICE